mmetsp:Transcript_26655/g.37522  ORF Transcript_26655/g.37522 Transcript_26655/m.37522 type:complete len:478 (+) Transcript_26655:25-1458(+)
MATLADEFVADLGEDEEVNDNEEKDEEDEPSDADESAPQEDMEVETVTFSQIKQIANLIQSDTLKDLLERVQYQMQVAPNAPNRKVIGPVEEHPEYKLVVDSNNMTVEIAMEISRIYKFIRDHYSKKFPELESLVMNPLDYASVVQRIANEMDLTKVDLNGILPAATIMVLTVTATTTSGTPLPEEEMVEVLEACKLILELDAARRKIVDYVESRMTFIAPNISTIVGSSIAARMISVAGGLTALAKMPPSNIPALGASKKTLAGFSSSTVKSHAGLLYECDIIKKTPSMWKVKAVRVLAGRFVLAARVDAFHQDPSGVTGSRFREEVEKKIEKWEEAPPMKLPKPLPAPDDRPKKRRGGKRVRKLKQKYQMTELRKASNRISFGTEAQETYRNTDKTLGMIGVSGFGKVRLTAQDKGILKKTKPQKSFDSGAASGLSSSLAFTPVQGLELNNPVAENKESKLRYFGTSDLTFHKTK